MSSVVLHCFRQYDKGTADAKAAEQLHNGRTELRIVAVNPLHASGHGSHLALRSSLAEVKS